MINFSNSPIKDCIFNNTTISCYEPHTCSSIQYNDKTLSDLEAENIFNKCIGEEQNNKASNPVKNLITSFIIIGGIIIVGCYVFTNVMYKKHYKSNFNSNNKFRNGSLKITLNNNNISNNNIISDNSQNNNTRSLDIIPSLSNHDNNIMVNVKTKNDEMNIYNALIAEIDEPLPSYDNNMNNNMTTKVNNKDDPNIYNASVVE